MLVVLLNRPCIHYTCPCQPCVLPTSPCIHKCILAWVSMCSLHRSHTRSVLGSMQSSVFERPTYAPSTWTNMAAAASASATDAAPATPTAMKNGSKPASPKATTPTAMRKSASPKAPMRAPTLRREAAWLAAWDKGLGDTAKTIGAQSIKEIDEKWPEFSNTIKSAEK